MFLFLPEPIGLIALKILFLLDCNLSMYSFLPHFGAEQRMFPISLGISSPQPMA